MSQEGESQGESPGPGTPLCLAGLCLWVHQGCLVPNITVSETPVINALSWDKNFPAQTSEQSSQSTPHARRRSDTFVSWTWNKGRELWRSGGWEAVREQVTNVAGALFCIGRDSHPAPGTGAWACHLDINTGNIFLGPGDLHSSGPCTVTVWLLSSRQHEACESLHVLPGLPATPVCSTREGG